MRGSLVGVDMVRHAMSAESGIEWRATPKTAVVALAASNNARPHLRWDGFALGGACVMAWLGDGAEVEGTIAYAAEGNLGFLGDGAGAAVNRNVLLAGGRLWATGASTTNRVDGNLLCLGGEPAGFAELATRTNWDGAGVDPADPTVDIDGTIGGRFRCGE
jgi:hypothetical protein